MHRTVAAARRQPTGIGKEIIFSWSTALVLTGGSGGSQSVPDTQGGNENLCSGRLLHDFEAV